ncbi:MAG: ABC transporter substrate-binding protein [Vampirovibrio sp.]
MAMPAWFFPFLQRVSLLLILGAGLFGVFFSELGVPQAEKKSTEALHPIEPYFPLQPKFYKSIHVQGHDGLESPYPIGRFGGTLYQSALGDGPKTLNPWAAFDGTSSALASLLTCQPLQSNAYTGETLPWVAKSVQISPDQTRIRLSFRHGLQWSDGHPLTVEDYLFTWNVIIQKGLGNPSTRDVLLVDGQFPRMRKINPDTVEVQTKRPYAPLLLNLGQAIAPKHIFEPILKAGGEKAFGAAWSTQDAEEHPERLVSCGPWVLEKYQAKERMIFKRNPYYYVWNREGKRLPYLEHEVFTFAKDLSHIQLLFEQGALHVHSAMPQNLARLQHLKSPAFRLMDLGPADGTTFMAFNLNPRYNKDGTPIVAPKVLKWFQHKAFRQALNLGVNRPQMVENVLKGLGSPLLTSLGLNHLYLNQALAHQVPYDVKGAKAKLASTGFHRDAKGHLRDADGHRVEFTLLTNSGNPEREAALVQLQNDYALLGIQVNLQPVEFNTLVDRMQSGRWEAMVMGLSGGGNFEPHQGANVFKSDAGLHLFNQRSPEAIQRLKTPGGDDRYAFEKRIDTLYDLGTTAFSLAKRRPYYDEIQSLLYDESPMVYLYTGKVITVVRRDLQNVEVTPLGGVLHNVESLWLNPL